MEKQSSKCQFCGSKTYGPSCPFSPYPKRLHAHVDDVTRCTWCGSKTLYGPGCTFSPTKHHMTGMNMFNLMVKESFIMGYVMKKIIQPITESAAFRMGLIDARGNIIKKTETIQERMAFGPIDKYVLKLKRLLGNKTDLLNTEIYLESAVKNAETSIELYEKELKLKHDIENIMKHFNQTINEASESGVSVPTIEKIILDSIKQ